MVDFLKFTFPAYIFSSLIFIFIYNKVGIFKLISNKNNKTIGALLIAFIFCMVGMSITDKFITTKGYHDFFVGLFLGPLLGLIIFIAPDINNKVK